MAEDRITLLKTKIGELFIGQYDCSKDSNGNVLELLKEAYTIQVIPTGQQSFNIMLLPVFVPISKDCVDLNVTNNVLAMTPPTEDLKNQYIAARTNLVVANSSKSNIIGA